MTKQPPPSRTAPLHQDGATLLQRSATVQRRSLQPLWNALEHARPRDDADAHATTRGLLLAISGGADSRALLEAVARWRGRRHHRIVVACIDHGIRPEARDEVDAVLARAAVLGLDGRSARLSPASCSEHDLRTARYDVLVQLARVECLSLVVTAHHAGDVAEGVLLQWAGRGGAHAGAAMRAHERLADDVTLWRPFLALPRRVLRAALDALQVRDFVVDPHDARGQNARAMLRLDVLAPLGVSRDALEDRLAAHATRMRDDEDALAGWANGHAPTPGAVADASATVDATLPPAVLRRVLRGVVKQLAGPGRDPRRSGDAIEQVLALVGRGATGSIDVVGGRMQIRTRDGRREVAVTPSRTHDTRQSLTLEPFPRRDDD